MLQCWAGGGGLEKPYISAVDTANERVAPPAVYARAGEHRILGNQRISQRGRHIQKASLGKRVSPVSKRSHGVRSRLNFEASESPEPPHSSLISVSTCTGSIAGDLSAALSRASTNDPHRSAQVVLRRNGNKSSIARDRRITRDGERVELEVGNSLSASHSPSRGSDNLNWFGSTEVFHVDIQSSKELFRQSRQLLQTLPEHLSCKATAAESRICCKDDNLLKYSNKGGDSNSSRYFPVLQLMGADLLTQSTGSRSRANDQWNSTIQQLSSSTAVQFLPAICRETRRLQFQDLSSGSLPSQRPLPTAQPSSCVLFLVNERNPADLRTSKSLLLSRANYRKPRRTEAFVGKDRALLNSEFQRRLLKNPRGNRRIIHRSCEAYHRRQEMRSYFRAWLGFSRRSKQLRLQQELQRLRSIKAIALASFLDWAHAFVAAGSRRAFLTRKAIEAFTTLLSQSRQMFQSGSKQTNSDPITNKGVCCFR